MSHFPSRLTIWSSYFIKAGHAWWIRNNATEAAALAFYSLFSLIPILIIGLFVASLLVGKEMATHNFFTQATEVTGFNVGDFLKQALSSDTTWFNNKYSPLLGGFILAFSATKVLNQLRKALSNIFGNPPPKKKSDAILSFITGRLISFLVIIALGFLIASSVISQSIINSILDYFPQSDYALTAFRFLSPLFTFVALVTLTSILMRGLPRKAPPLREAIIGSSICSILIMLLKYVLSLFLRHGNISDVFGGALTLVLILLWIYLAMQALLYSAEFTAALTQAGKNPDNLDTTPENACTSRHPE